jgi:uncharacterized DUF497 family protein
VHTLRHVPDEEPEWTWNIEKARGNLQKHGVAFADAVTALEDPLALTIPDRARGEERFVTIGLAADGALLVVAWSPRGTGGRILSARRATRRERRDYEDEP